MYADYLQVQGRSAADGVETLQSSIGICKVQHFFGIYFLGILT